MEIRAGSIHTWIPFAALIQAVVHTEKYFRNIIESNLNQIVFTISRLTWNQTDVRLVQNQSASGKYNLISS